MPVLSTEDTVLFANPDKDIQQSFVGVSFEDAYAEAASFLTRAFRSALPGRETFDGMKIVDFGCGWGRMLRLLRDNRTFDAAELFGLEPQLRVLDLCRRSIPNVCLMKNDLFPPTDLRAGVFDFIYAFSVFSHLSPICHHAWAQEFARLLKPGGMAVVTTRPRSWIAQCAAYREGRIPATTPHEQKLARSFSQPDCLERYDRGEFLYEPSGAPGLDPAAYGEAVVPRRVFDEEWARFGFRLKEWNDDPSNPGGQCIATLQMSR